MANVYAPAARVRLSPHGSSRFHHEAFPTVARGSDAVVWTLNRNDQSCSGAVRIVDLGVGVDVLLPAAGRRRADPVVAVGTAATFAPSAPGVPHSPRRSCCTRATQEPPGTSSTGSVLVSRAEGRLGWVIGLSALRSVFPGH